MQSLSTFLAYSNVCIQFIITSVVFLLECSERIKDLELEVDKLSKEKSSAATLMETNTVLRDKIKVEFSIIIYCINLLLNFIKALL